MKTDKLPTEKGFYWWRASKGDSWRLIQIVDLGNGMLVSYDIELKSFSGLMLDHWIGHNPIGYWIKLKKP